MSVSEGDALELRAHKVCAPAQAALSAILAAIPPNHSEIFYVVKCRPKSVKKAIDKVLRKRTEDGKQDYEPETITDIAGIRVVTLFREDVIAALRLFLNMINHDGPFIISSPFIKGKLKEGIIFTTAPKGDPEAITRRLKTVFEEQGHPIGEESIRSENTGYSSIHLVAEVQVPYDGNLTTVPVEIQIRTVFEDAWAEIDHKLRYSLTRSRRAAEIGDWRAHLGALKTLVDGCSQYAGVIKNQAIDPTAKQFEMAPIKPVDNASQAFEQMGSISERLKNAMGEAYAKRSEAIDLAARGGDAHHLFLEAATLFGMANTVIEGEQFGAPSNGDAAFFLANMEQAFCLLSSEDKAAIDEAIGLYKEMQKRSPRSVIVHYRHAQALQKLREYEAAERLYAIADGLLASDKHVPKDHWLHDVVPRQWGFCVWTRSLTLEAPELLADRLTLLRKAYLLTCTAYQRSPEGSVRRVRAANNALYYGVEFCGLWKQEAAIDPIDKHDLSLYLQLLESKVEVSETSIKQLSWLDSMCRAYVEFGKSRQAISVAERIEELLADTASAPDEGLSPSFYAIVGNLNARERDIQEHANWVLRTLAQKSKEPALDVSVVT